MNIPSIPLGKEARERMCFRESCKAMYKEAVLQSEYKSEGLGLMRHIHIMSERVSYHLLFIRKDHLCKKKVRTVTHTVEHL